MIVTATKILIDKHTFPISSKAWSKNFYKEVSRVIENNFKLLRGETHVVVQIIDLPHVSTVKYIKRLKNIIMNNKMLRSQSWVFTNKYYTLLSIKKYIEKEIQKEILDYGCLSDYYKLESINSCIIYKTIIIHSNSMNTIEIFDRKCRKFKNSLENENLIIKYAKDKVWINESELCINSQEYIKFCEKFLKRNWDILDTKYQEIHIIN